MFSDRETQIIKIIGRKKVSLEDISSKLFQAKSKPFDGNISVANSVRRIIKKCQYHNLQWTLDKTRKENKLVIKKVKLH